MSVNAARRLERVLAPLKRLGRPQKTMARPTKWHAAQVNACDTPKKYVALRMSACATVLMLCVSGQTYDLAWAPDGKTIAFAAFKEVLLLDPTDAKLISLKGAADAVRAIAFSKDGSLLAAAGGLPGRSGEVQIWKDRKLIHTIKGHSDCIYGVAFSPDGKKLATSSYDKLIKLWDLPTEKEIRALKDHIDAVYALAFTPDGKRLVSGAADRTVKIWNVETGERLYTLSEPQDGINTIALDPTGKYVAAAGLDKTIRIWSLGEKSGKLENSLIAHEDTILKLAWSADGKLLASSSADKSVAAYSIPDLIQVVSYPQPDWVYALQFSPDSEQLAIKPFSNGAFSLHAMR
jgi:WD40 repeat protein